MPAARHAVCHTRLNALRLSARPGYDDRIMSGWASIGQTREESEKTMAKLIESEGLPPADD
jgi:hypothetical protein